jgi:hypothetical protein
MCLELEVEHDGLDIEEMSYAVKTEVDKRLNKTFNVGIKDLSETLIKFLTEEYDYVIKDKEGNIYSHNLKVKILKDKPEELL